MDFSCSYRKSDGLTCDADRAHRHPGGSWRAPVSHGDLPVRPGGRGGPERQAAPQRPRGKRAGRRRGRGQVQVDAHVHLQPVAGRPPAFADAVPSSQQRRRLSFCSVNCNSSGMDLSCCNCGCCGPFCGLNNRRGCGCVGWWNTERDSYILAWWSGVFLSGLKSYRVRL